MDNAYRAYLILAFGGAAILVPIGYFLIRGFRSKRSKMMLVGVALQFYWTLMILTVLALASRLGFGKSWMTVELLMVVNLVAFLGYLGVALWPRPRRRDDEG